MYYAVDSSPTILNQIQSDVIAFVRNPPVSDYVLLATQLDASVAHVDDYAKGNPKRNFVYVEFANTNANIDRVKDMVTTDLLNPKHILFVSANGKHICLILQCDVNLTKAEYLAQCRSLSTQAGIAITPNSEKIRRPIPMRNLEPEDILSVNQSGMPLPVSALSLGKVVKLAPDESKLLAATDLFLEEPMTLETLSNKVSLTQVIDSFVSAVISGMVTRAYVYEAFNRFSAKTGVDVANYRNLYEERYVLLTAQPELCDQAPPIGNYIHLYALASSANNISQQLKASLPSGVEPDPEFTLAEAGEFIEMCYPPYLLKQHGSDVDNLVIYNAATGVWTQDRDTLYALLTAIKPYTSKHQFENFLSTFAAKARNAGRIIAPYTGSRYIVFNNCVLDVRSMRTVALTDPVVRGFNFTERSVLHIDWIDNPEVPLFPGKRQADNGAWSPQEFIHAYGNNDFCDFDEQGNPRISQVTYFLFGLSLGLFGAHNFGVHFDIQGESRWGKTTLSEIYNALYNYRTVTISFSALNGQFPFTSYPPNTSLIWIKECNEGVDPLDDENGTVIYDGLADNQVRFQVKGKGDIVLSNPPQVYVDGTQFLQAREIYTGPAGRTLAYKLPQMDKAGKLRAQAYSSSILECLQDERTLQWLCWAMLTAYRKVVPDDRIDDLKLNLSNKTDLRLFPDFSIDWRREFAKTGSTIDEWFQEEFVPYLCEDTGRPTLIHPFLIYAMYEDFYTRNRPDDPVRRYISQMNSVMSRFKVLVAANDLVYEECGDSQHTNRRYRKQVKDYKSINFDWKSYSKDTDIPEKIKGELGNVLPIFGKRVTDWYYIYPERYSNQIAKQIKSQTK